MRWSLLKFHKCIVGKPGKGLLLLGLFLSLLLLANSSFLHKAIHPNAGSPEHQCGVTLLAWGQIEAPATGAVLIIALVLSCCCFRETPALVQSFPFLPPGRAPPAFSPI